MASSQLRTAALFLLFIAGNAMAEETVSPLKDGKAPATFEQVWAGFDPRKEPLDVEVLHEWEEDGTVLKVLRYRVGCKRRRESVALGGRKVQRSVCGRSSWERGWRLATRC